MSDRVTMVADSRSILCLLVFLGVISSGKAGLLGQNYSQCPECFIEENIIKKQVVTTFPPRGKNGAPVKLFGKIVVKELMDMSVKEETLRVMAWVRLIWLNPDTSWNVTEYPVREVRVRPSQIWMPDMVISNSLADFEILNYGSSLPVIVGYTGFTFWSVPVIVSTKCKADVTYFPFDSQQCKIKMNSWTYHNKMIDFQISGFSTSLESTVGNIEWEIVAVDGRLEFEENVTNHPLYPGEVIRYPYLDYTIHLNRKPDFYVNSLLIPSLLLSWLGSVIFLLPTECGEKLGFAVTLFLALYVNQVIVAEFLPPSADSFPLIAKFYTLITFCLGFSIILTVFTLMLHHRINHDMLSEDSFMYRCLNKFEKLGQFSFLSALNKLLHSMSRTCCGMKQKIARKLSAAHDLGVGESRTEEAMLPTTLSNSYTAAAAASNAARKISAVASDVTCSPRVEALLVDICGKLSIIAKDDAAELAKKRWELIAAGLDTFFFVCYVLSLLVITSIFSAMTIMGHTNQLH